jgi:hypothetical protein
MIKSQFIISFFIILLGLAPVKAGKNKVTYKKPVPLPALAFKKPTVWSDCGDLAEDGRSIVKAAITISLIPNKLIPESDEALVDAKCSWGLSNNSYSFYKFEHKKGNSICTVYAVASLLTHRMRQQGNMKYSAEHTKTANEEMGLCTPIAQEEESLQVEDTFALKKPQDEVHPVNLPEIKVEVPKSNFFHEYQAKLEQTNAEVESFPENGNFDEDLEPEFEPSKFVRQNAFIWKSKTPAYEPTLEDFDEDLELELPRLELEPPKLRRQNARFWKLKTPAYEPTSEDFDQLFNKQEEHDALHTHLMGGWQNCTKENLSHVPRYLSVLNARNVILGIHTYTENVVHCEQQIVNGTNFNVKVGFNQSVCQIAFHVSLDNEVTALTTATPFEGVPPCTQMLKPLL